MKVTFNKEIAFDLFMKEITLPPDSSYTDIHKMIEKGREILNNIYINGYREGLEKGLKQLEINKEN